MAMSAEHKSKFAAPPPQRNTDVSIRVKKIIEREENRK